MQIYLVGGAVRDALLGLSSNDQDWVVVGASPQEMSAQGYLPVGQDFPVFLHPKTKQEYALARTERKSGQGYSGFECFYAPNVTLEEDLLRRDLTINAMAKAPDGTIIDPFKGQADIKNKVLRHVSDAFTEDPLRVLRVARFAAKLAPLGFKIAPETLNLMKKIVKQGELEYLTSERVWQEWQKSLKTQAPDIFLSVLKETKALAVILPEIDRLFGVPQSQKWHPEIDAGVHTLMVINQVAKLTKDVSTRFAASLHDLGKALTPKCEWPSHKQHCEIGLAPIKALCIRLKVPNECKDLALLVCKHHTSIHQALELEASAIIALFNQLDVWRKPKRFEQILTCCQADHQGRLGFEKTPYPQKEHLLQSYKKASLVDVQTIIAQGFKGCAIKEELDKLRILAVHELKLKN